MDHWEMIVIERELVWPISTCPHILDRLWVAVGRPWFGASTVTATGMSIDCLGMILTQSVSKSWSLPGRLIGIGDLVRLPKLLRSDIHGLSDSGGTTESMSAARVNFSRGLSFARPRSISCWSIFCQPAKSTALMDCCLSRGRPPTDLRCVVMICLPE